MPRTKARPKKRTKAPARSNGQLVAPDVLTLDEAAAYLRVTPDAVLRMIGEEQLPARHFGSEWRFAKAAVQAWLASGPPKAGLMEEFGKMKDDPYLEEMLRDIYKRRGRPEVEEP